MWMLGALACLVGAILGFNTNYAAVNNTALRPMVQFGPYILAVLGVFILFVGATHGLEKGHHH